MGNDGTITIDTKVNTKSFEVQISVLEDELETLAEEYEALEKAKPFEGKENELRKMREQAEKLRNKLGDLKEKQKDLESSNLSNIGFGFENLTKKVVKFGLSLLGVRTIYGLVSKVARSYMSQNEQVANTFSGLWNSLLAQLEPYIEKVINEILKLIAYFNVFLKTITGGRIDLTKKMDKNTKSVKGTSGAMKELNKQMAQFDEATKLQDNVNVGAGGSSNLDNGLDLPQLSQETIDKITNFALKVKDVLSWIWEHLPEIIGIIGSIKIAKWLYGITSLIGVAGAGVTGAGGSGLVGATTALLALAAAVSTLAAYQTWQEVIDNWNKLQDELSGRSKKGVTYEENLEKAKEISNDVNATIEQVNKAYAHNTASVTKNNYVMKNAVKTNKEYGNIMAGVDVLLRGDNSLRMVNLDIIHEENDEIQNGIQNNRELIKNKKLTQEQTSNLIDEYVKEIGVLRDIRDELPKGSLAYKDMSLSIDMLTGDIKKYGNENQIAQAKILLFGTNMQRLALDIKDTQGAVDGSITSMINYNNTPLNDKHATITLDANTAGAESTIAGFANRVASKFQNAFNGLNINKVTNSFIDNLSKLFPSLKGTWNTFRSSIGLARGGIINLPGAGVPLAGGVVGGERAAEGVIPLTDSQQMEILGEAIGKYITINASITNTMNGRVISRELQKINGENDFASNR